MADEAARKGFPKVLSAVPLGSLARLLWFLLLCLILFVIGLGKAAIFGPLAILIFFVGDMAVVIGLWPAHVIMMYRAVAMTKKLGILLKSFLILLLPIPLLLWPIGVGVGSVLAGLGYGVGQPLVATFEAVGKNMEDKLYHTFADGTVSTLTGAFKFVRDFYDFIYHSFFESVQDFRLGEPKNGKPVEVTLHELPLCAFVGLLGMLVDTPAISIVALCKMPIMLFKGWRQLLLGLVGTGGSCLETACVPFAGLAIVFWPLVVVASALTAILCSPFFGLYSAAVVYQEMSYKCGLKYIVAIVAEFDEYSSDVLHSHEGSCLPRPKYRQNQGTPELHVVAGASDIENVKGKDEQIPTLEIPKAQLNTQKSLRQTLIKVKLVHILENKFATIERDGKLLINAGVLTHLDVEAAMTGDKTKGKIMLECLPAYSLLKNLIHSAQLNSTGMVLLDGTEVTMSNRPSERLAEWFFEPLLTLKDQLRAAHLQESEELYLEKYILMGGDTRLMGSWQNGGVEPENDMRRGELQALARRIQGISNSISRVPTYRRRLENVVKTFQAHVEHIDTGSGNLNKSKSAKKARIYNLRSLMKEGSKRFLPTNVAASERRRNSEDIDANAEQAV